jgi:hypothetical protein
MVSLVVGRATTTSHPAGFLHRELANMGAIADSHTTQQLVAVGHLILHRQPLILHHHPSQILVDLVASSY